MRAILKENMANYISLEKVNECRFRKKYELPVSSIPQKKIANNRENDLCHLTELIGYQVQAHWQNKITAQCLSQRINYQKCLSIFRYSDRLFFN